MQTGRKASRAYTDGCRFSVIEAHCRQRIPRSHSQRQRQTAAGTDYQQGLPHPSKPTVSAYQLYLHLTNHPPLPLSCKSASSPVASLLLKSTSREPQAFAASCAGRYTNGGERAWLGHTSSCTAYSTPARTRTLQQRLIGNPPLVPGRRNLYDSTLSGLEGSYRGEETPATALYPSTSSRRT